MRIRTVWLFLALLFPMAAHASLPCSAYPNTLTNGTLADANQVMANFNSILNCVNSLSPLGIPVVGSSSKIAANLGTAGTVVTVTADSITVGTALNGTSYTLTSYSQSFNGATVGAGGMDVGTLPTSSWVALYAIYNPTAPAISILGTTCASACPTVYAGGNMPAGYTASALLAVFPTNATPAMVAGYVKNKTFTYAGSQNALNTSTAHASPTSLSITSSVPPDATYVNPAGQLICGTTPGPGSMSITVLSASTDTSLNFLSFNCNSLNSNALITPIAPQPLVTPQTIFYTNAVVGTSPTTILNILGYVIP